MSNEAFDIIKKEKKLRTGKLVIGNAELSEIPNDLLEMPWLKELWLFNNQIKEIKNALEKAAASAQDVNGIKSVVNNVTKPAPMVEAPPVEVNSDATMMQGVKDATKDFPTVTANVNAGVITLTGSIKRSNLQTLMMSLNTLKPKKIDNQLTIK